MSTRLSRFAAFLLIGGMVIAAPTSVRAQSNATPAAYSPTIDPANFTQVIDNPWMPLAPGAHWIYQGTSEDGPETDEVTVTSDTKVIMGVTCVAVHDVVSTDGDVTEDTIDYYAQDLDGNVWYFGEESHEVENGKVVGTEGSWEGGVDGAFPGIQMLASPQESVAYRQEYYAGEAEDMARVIETDATVSAPFGDFDHALVTEEWSPLEPDVIEHKSYARGVGLVTDEEAQGGSESIRLTDYSPGVATPTS